MAEPPYKKLAKSNRNIATLRLNPKRNVDLVAKIKRMQTLMGTTLPKVIIEANIYSLEFIQETALSNLQASMRDSRIPFRTGTLERAIVDPAFSKADQFGIRFLIDELIRPKVPYFAALEYGDRSQVGKRRPFIFLSTPGGGRSHAGAAKSQFSQENEPSRARGSRPKRRDSITRTTNFPSHLRTDRIVGPREIRADSASKGRGEVGDSNIRAKISQRGHITGSGVYMVTIKRPVPNYEYGQRAGSTFLTEGIYEQYLDARLKTIGLDREGIRYIMTGR